MSKPTTNRNTNSPSAAVIYLLFFIR